ncbi:hypothetical protein GLOIN_2v1824252 [Rhizophagus irregularis DAOM 181602=DAOM 197198]|nr:hypothetical protein GLOIN_2v1824252 [Rhizophagus irregularis DAOM 181602=DAOM 197198]
MLNIGDLVGNPNNAEDFLKFISYNGYQYLHEVTAELGSFVENGFLKTLFDKSPQAMNKAQLLHFTLRPSRGDDTKSECPSTDDKLFTSTSSSNTKTTQNPVLETPPILPDVEMTSVNQTVTSKTSWKKDKQKARVTDDKQVKNQLTTANPSAQTGRIHLYPKLLKY